MIRRILFILIAAATAVLLILIGIATFILWPVVTSAHSTSRTTVTPTVSAATTPTTQNGNGVAKQLRQYVPDVKVQIAKGLKLTSEQLTAELRSGKTLSDVAKAQGVSATQLQTIITNAVEMGFKPAVDDGTITQQQLDKLAKRYASHPALLDKLLGGKVAKKVPATTPTPTVQ